MTAVNANVTTIAPLVPPRPSGEGAAFEEIVRQQRARVYKLAYRMLRAREEAEDVTQETFVKAFEALPTLREPAALQTWLCRIAASLCLSRLRAPRYRRELPTETLAWQGGGDPAREEAEFARLVRETMAQLPPHYRLLIEACYVEGRSYKETARLTGVGVETLKTRLFRARRLLRGRLREALGG